MTTEIKKSDWARFCKKFNETNRYRQAKISLKEKGKSGAEINTSSSFMGLALTRKGRVLSGIELVAGRQDPEKIIEPIAAIQNPVKVILEKDDRGLENKLVLESKGGTVASIILSGEQNQGHHALVEKVAYTLSERRGFTPGNELNDWYEAERRIHEAEHRLSE